MRRNVLLTQSARVLQMVQAVAKVLHTKGEVEIPPTLHAHSTAVLKMRRALKCALRQRARSKHRWHAAMVQHAGGERLLMGLVAGPMQRLRSVLVRLRTDPEASTDDTAISLALAVGMMHAICARTTSTDALEDVDPATAAATTELWCGDVRRRHRTAQRTTWMQTLRNAEGEVSVEGAEYGLAQELEGYVCEMHALEDPSADTVRMLGGLALQYAERFAWATRLAVANRFTTIAPLPHTLDVATAIESLVLRADAELGAQVFRDMILSFGLPREVVGLRHTLLLSRETAGHATRDHPALVEHAHAAALQGPSRVWEFGVMNAYGASLDDEETDSNRVDRPHFLQDAERAHNELEARRAARLADRDAVERSAAERACVVLAGLAMLFAPSAREARKGIAFQGRVRLPFFALPAPANGAQGTLDLLSDGSWAFFSRVEGGLKLVHRAKGLEGLCTCAALLMHAASTR